MRTHYEQKLEAQDKQHVAARQELHLKYQQLVETRIAAIKRKVSVRAVLI